MGDRANIFIQTIKRDDGQWDGVGIYSHWGGDRFQELARFVIDGPIAAQRIGDVDYYTRIVLQGVLNQAFEEDQPTGGGVWIDGPCDNDGYSILVCNAETGRSWYTDIGSYRLDEEEVVA